MTALRVMLVEDETLLALTFAEVLEDMGYDVCAVEATEAAAVKAADWLKPDFMIVDAGLGDGSGISAVDQILRSGYIPHLFISGDISGVYARKPDAIVIQKPFRVAELARGIQCALRTAAGRH